MLAGCGARGAETKNPNIVVAAWIAGPDGFNPLVTVGSAATMIEDEIFSPLIDLGPDMRPRGRR
jgi:pheromone shutdown protein TraB